ncbi:MAG: hypothetical protein N2746_01535, partial [Deltaproteobacteria bacterium]|nr:hypothetical protein [Deltaproteobacteria bacterium]
MKGKYKVIGQKDIDKMLFWETNKQLKNCTDSSCLMQIAGAMGAEYYIEGSVGAMGKRYILTLKYIDAYKVEIIKRKTEVMERDEDSLLISTKRIVREMFGKDGKTGKEEKAGDMKKEVVAVEKEVSG